MSLSKFLTGFAVGAAIGAVAGILLAPKSGAETREMIGEMASDVARKTDETVKDTQLEDSEIHQLRIYLRDTSLLLLHLEECALELLPSLLISLVLLDQVLEFFLLLLLSTHTMKS